MNGEVRSRPFSGIFLGSLMPALAGLIWLTLNHGYDTRFLAGLMIWTLVGWWLISRLAGQGRNLRWVLALGSVHLCFLTPEIYLRVFGFHYQSGIHFAFPSSFQFLERDPDLFWTLPKEQAGVNAMGFRGDEAAIPKPEGLCRVLFLGDSVAGQGYPQLVEDLLSREGGFGRVECVNLSLAGYSSHQGRVLTDKYGAILDPDAVVIGYGWNDHWLAYQSIDSQKTMAIPTPWQRRRESLIHHVRILQLGRYLLAPIRGDNRPVGKLRVPLEQYRENLRYMGNFFSQRGAAVILLTAPSSHHLTGVPEYLVSDGFAAEAGAVTRLHGVYNRSARAAAADNGWHLLDLENEWRSAPHLATYFLKDGIHLTPTGLEKVAERLALLLGERLREGAE